MTFFPLLPAFISKLSSCSNPSWLHQLKIAADIALRHQPSIATPILWMGIPRSLWDMGRFGVRTSVSWLSQKHFMILLVQSFLSPPLLRAEPNSSQWFSLVWDTLHLPVLLEKFPFELEDSTQGSDFWKAPFITRLCQCPARYSHSCLWYLHEPVHPSVLWVSLSCLPHFWGKLFWRKVSQPV